MKSVSVVGEVEAPARAPGSGGKRDARRFLAAAGEPLYAAVTGVRIGNPPSSPKSRTQRRRAHTWTPASPTERRAAAAQSSNNRSARFKNIGQIYRKPPAMARRSCIQIRRQCSPPDKRMPAIGRTRAYRTDFLAIPRGRISQQARTCAVFRCDTACSTLGHGIDVDDF